MVDVAAQTSTPRRRRAKGYSVRTLPGFAVIAIFTLIALYGPIVILVVFSLFALWTSFLALKGRDYATTQKGGGGLMKRDMRPWEKVGAYSLVIFILLIVLSPHFGLLLLSFGTIWSYSVLPDAFTLDHYVEVLANSSEFITNTLLYAGLAALADVIFATAIASVHLP